MRKYEVFLEVSGWVKIGEVEADNVVEARKLAEKVEHESTIFDPSDCVDLLEIAHPKSIDVDELLEDDLPF